MNGDLENASGLRGRPRKVSDAALLAAAHRALGEVGPQRLTLGHVARQAEVSPATLVHRFGGRETLLLRLSEMVTVAIEKRSAQAVGAGSALDALLELVRDASGVAASPSALANHLAFLQVELASPACRAFLERRQSALRDGIRARLDAALSRGEIVHADVERLAALIQATMTGTQICWLLTADGPLSEQVAENIRALLRPYQPRTRQPAAG